MAKKKIVDQKKRMAIIKAFAQFKLKESVSLKDIEIVLENMKEEIRDLAGEPEFISIGATDEEITEVIRGLLIDILKLAQKNLEEADISKW